jgi:hypothetical protein
VAVAVPDNVIPSQQKMNCPETELKSSVAPPPSFFRQTSKVVTVKLHIAVLPEASVAVQVTVVVPSGNADPEGGTQATVAPGQLSPIVGDGNVTGTVGSPGLAAVTILSGGQAMVGAC